MNYWQNYQDRQRQHAYQFDNKHYIFYYRGFHIKLS